MILAEICTLLSRFALSNYILGNLNEVYVAIRQQETPLALKHYDNCRFAIDQLCGFDSIFRLRLHLCPLFWLLLQLQLYTVT